MAPFYNVFCVVVLLQGYLVTLVEMSHIPNDDWRLDKDYDPWSRKFDLAFSLVSILS